MKAMCLCIALFFSLLAFTEEPPSPNDLIDIYNQAQKAQLEGRHQEALKGFLTVKKHWPTDWQTLVKVIQEYSALAMLQARDTEIAALYAFRATLPEKDQKPAYCREQIPLGKQNLVVLEYFELQGEYPIKYKFYILDEAEKIQDFHFSLGSYGYTTRMAHAAGTLPKKDRLFHLDGYFPESEHRTYGFFINEPDYDIVRQMIIDILQGKLKEQSSGKDTPEGRVIKLNVPEDYDPDQ